MRDLVLLQREADHIGVWPDAPATTADDDAPRPSGPDAQ
ncbi:hypothetical protein SAZ_17015 [Streptomyces noursei ZPM]|nr:hypothetical protein SAZ_17015 [Streptomyces noursei ZPM]EPY92936.1 hypothetical protein K530_50695 [Streptomyces noursei CCRC 11814]